MSYKVKKPHSHFEPHTSVCSESARSFAFLFREKQATTKWIAQNNCIFTVTCKTVKNNLKNINFDEFCLLGRLRWVKQAQEKAAIVINSWCLCTIVK